MTPQLHALALLVPIFIIIVALAGWLSWMLTSYPPKRVANAMLNAREQTTLAAAADAFFPAGGPIPISGTDAGAIRYFAQYMQRAHSAQRLLTRLLIAFTEYSPLWFGPVRHRFSRLNLQQRIRFLDHAFVSSIYFRRVAFISLRTLMTMAYLSNREVARHLNIVRDTDPFGTGGRVLEVLPQGGAAA